MNNYDSKQGLDHGDYRILDTSRLDGLNDLITNYLQEKNLIPSSNHKLYISLISYNKNIYRVCAHNASNGGCGACTDGPVLFKSYYHHLHAKKSKHSKCYNNKHIHDFPCKRYWYSAEERKALSWTSNHDNNNNNNNNHSNNSSYSNHNQLDVVAAGVQFGSEFLNNSHVLEPNINSQADSEPLDSESVLLVNDHNSDSHSETELQLVKGNNHDNDIKLINENHTNLNSQQSEGLAHQPDSSVTNSRDSVNNPSESGDLVQPDLEDVAAAMSLGLSQPSSNNSNNNYNNNTLKDLINYNRNNHDNNDEHPNYTVHRGIDFVNDSSSNYNTEDGNCEIIASADSEATIVAKSLSATVTKNKKRKLGVEQRDEQIELSSLMMRSWINGSCSDILRCSPDLGTVKVHMKQSYLSRVRKQSILNQLANFNNSICLISNSNFKQQCLCKPFCDCMLQQCGCLHCSNIENSRSSNYNHLTQSNTCNSRACKPAEALIHNRGITKRRTSNNSKPFPP